jgi:hypothetical protein
MTFWYVCYLSLLVLYLTMWSLIRDYDESPSPVIPECRYFIISSIVEDMARRSCQSDLHAIVVRSSVYDDRYLVMLLFEFQSTSSDGLSVWSGGTVTRCADWIAFASDWKIPWRICICGLRVRVADFPISFPKWCHHQFNNACIVGDVSTRKIADVSSNGAFKPKAIECEIISDKCYSAFHPEVLESARD